MPALTAASVVRAVLSATQYRKLAVRVGAWGCRCGLLLLGCCYPKDSSIVVDST